MINNKLYFIFYRRSSRRGWFRRSGSRTSTSKPTQAAQLKKDKKPLYPNYGYGGYWGYVNGRSVNSNNNKRTWIYGRGWVTVTTQAPELPEVQRTTSPRYRGSSDSHPGSNSQGSSRSCPLINKGISKIMSMPETIQQCLEAAPEKCCSIGDLAKRFALAPMKVKVETIKVAAVYVTINFAIKKAKKLQTQIHEISGAMEKNVTKIELVERAIDLVALSKIPLKECVPHITRCLQKGNVPTNLGNEPGKVTHSAALLYTDDGAKYLIEKGGNYGTKNDRRQIRRVFWRINIWTNYKTITPKKQRSLYDYYDVMGKGYDLYNDNCHDATKDVERLAEKNT